LGLLCELLFSLFNCANFHHLWETSSLRILLWLGSYSFWLYLFSTMISSHLPDKFIAFCSTCDTIFKWVSVILNWIYSLLKIKSFLIQSSVIFPLVHSHSVALICRYEILIHKARPAIYSSYEVSYEVFSPTLHG